jgi:hypothetical protein
MNQTPLAVFRSPERVCLVCGDLGAGHRLILVHPDGDPDMPFQLELPLCDAHKDDPEDDLIRTFQKSFQADQAQREAALIHEQAQELTKRPCIICDRRATGVKAVELDDHQAALVDAEPGSVLFVPLCKSCGDATGPEAWADAVVFEKEVMRHATTPR